MTHTFGSGKITVDYLSLGACDVCGRRLTTECEHSQRIEYQEWYAAYLVSPYELPESPSVEWLEQAYLDHADWQDEQATIASAR